MREALFALWALDLELGAVVAGASDPMIAEIKLAWWREALERLDGAPPPAQPLLQALAAEVLPHAVSGAALARLEDGWLAALRGEGAPVLVAGSVLYWLAARLLDPSASAQAEPVEAGCSSALQPGFDRLSLSGNNRLRLLDGLVRLAARDEARHAVGKPYEPRGGLIRQLILLRAVALGR